MGLLGHPYLFGANSFTLVWNDWNCEGIHIYKKLLSRPFSGPCTAIVEVHAHTLIEPFGTAVHLVFASQSTPWYMNMVDGNDNKRFPSTLFIGNGPQGTELSWHSFSSNGCSWDLIFEVPSCRVTTEFPHYWPSRLIFLTAGRIRKIFSSVPRLIF